MSQLNTHVLEGLSEPADWRAFRRAVRASSPHNFEDLVARVLEHLSGERFLLARSGDQPTGDGRSVLGMISFQAKRYSGRKALDTNSLRGEIRRIAHELPRLEVFVLAVTRSAAQVQDALDREAATLGLEILYLGLGDDDPVLGHLCAVYWDKLCSDLPFLADLPSELHGWMIAKGRSAESHRRVALVQKEVGERVVSYRRTREEARVSLERRIGVADRDRARFSFTIDVEASVPRRSLQEAVLAWWTKSTSRVCYLEGEEGTGKSWAAAQCAHSIAQDKGAIVLWLDSIQWSDLNSVQSVILTALTGPDDRRERIATKALERWKDPVLIVLDGANQHAAVGAVHRILADLFGTRASESHVRILFTTRPLNMYPDYRGNLWNGCHKVHVGPFDEVELSEALWRSKLVLHDIPPSLLALAAYPRYFDVCMELRDRLRSFENVTREMLLYQVLLRRVADDEQLRTALDARSPTDVRALLRKLAESAPELASGERDTLIQMCFMEGYPKARTALLELRLADEAQIFACRPSADTVTLGWALYVLQTLLVTDGGLVGDLADVVRRALEPLSHDDLRTEALFVALQLTAVDPSLLGSDAEAKQAALLRVWIPSPNANVSSARLAYWARDQTSAYAAFVDAFYEQLWSASDQSVVSTPLAAAWQAGGQAAEAMKPWLRRWLLLVWPAEQGEERVLAHESARLPIARSQDQLRLSALAISIISLQPDLDLLDAIALAAATQELSRVRIGDRERPAKLLDANLGLLMRWSYTERCLPRLVEMAEEQGLLREGCGRLATHLKLVDLPEPLRSPPPAGRRSSFVSTRDLIVRGHRLFKEEDVDGARRGARIDMAHLAVRSDLPAVQESDLAIIGKRIDEVVDRGSFRHTATLSAEDHEFESLWPWLARVAPGRLAKLAGTLRLKALGYASPRYLLHFLSGVWQTQVGKDARTLAQQILARSPDRLSDEVALWEALLQVGSSDEWITWLGRVAPDSQRRAAALVYPIPFLLRELLPEGAYQHAKARLHELGRPSASDKTDDLTEFDFLCYVVACRSGEDERLHHWARTQLAAKPRSASRPWLFAVLAASGKRGWFNAVLVHGTIRMMLDSRVLGLVHEFSRDSIWIEPLSSSYEECVEVLPPDEAGNFFYETEAHASLERWGRGLLAQVTSLVNEPPFEPEHRGRTVVEQDRDGVAKSMRDESPDRNAVMADTASWGLDYAQPADLAALAASTQEGEALGRREEFESWRRDVDRLTAWDHRALALFGASPALRAWADSHQAEFVAMAEKLLERARSSRRSLLHLGVFLDSTLGVLLRFRLREAWDMYRDLLAHSMTRVRSQFGAASMVERLWDIDWCGTEGHANLRREVLREAQTDEEIMLQTLAAFAGGGEQELREHAYELLSAELARDRALAVSVLAWFTDEDALSMLETTGHTDPSQWVRVHASRATEVVRQERSCRAVYRDALALNDPVEVSARLQCLRPALAPTARWWHWELEGAVDLTTRSAEVRAVLISFWHHWGAVVPSKVEVCGWDLRRSCRGEVLKEHLSARMSPWWSPSYEG